jgi:protein-S-isoprenylcysteine O-methyltransferase Ste14
MRSTSHLLETTAGTMMTETEVPAGLMRKFVLRTTIWLLFLFGVLFAAAGTLDWLGGWIYFGLSVVITVAGGLWLLRRDPDLLEERLGSLVQRDQKGWDKIFMLAMLVLWVGWLVLIGLDAKRFHWSHVPFSVQMLGLALLVLATYIIGLTFRENSYAAPVIKIQKERGHQVVSTGPYAYVRHPMYAGAVLYIIGIPLLLGSWWGLAASILIIVLIGVRAVLEERTLAEELEGYAQYASRVRYRLVPYLW